MRRDNGAGVNVTSVKEDAVDALKVSIIDSTAVVNETTEASIDKDDDDALKRSINDRLDKMIEESGARAIFWSLSNNESSSSLSPPLSAPPLLVYEYKPIKHMSNIMPPDLLHPPSVTSTMGYTFPLASSSQSVDFEYEDDEYDAAWEIEDAAEELNAKPLPRHERRKSQCGGRVADDAGDVPKNASIAFCPCGVTEGETITIWGPHSTVTMTTHLTVIDNEQRKKKKALQLSYNPSFQQLRRRAWPRACVLGPDYFILCLTYFLILSPSSVWLALVTPRLHRALFGVGLATLLVVVLSLAFTAWSDPGTVPKQSPGQLLLQKKRIARAAELAERKKCKDEAHYRPGAAGAMALSRFSSCSICNVLRDYGTSHCTSCNACCVDLDHHCPWTGKCIGKGNLQSFFVFVYSLGVHIALVVASTIALFASGKYKQALPEGGI